MRPCWVDVLVSDTAVGFYIWAVPFLQKEQPAKKTHTFSITKIIHTKISLSQHHNKKLDDLKSMKGDKIVQKNGQGLKNLSLPNTACFRLL